MRSIIDEYGGFENLPVEHKVNILKIWLQQSDYIDNKLTEAIAEALITGDNSNVVALKQEYSKQLSDRVSWRQQINELENSVQRG